MAPEIPSGVYSVVGGNTYDRKRVSFRLRGDRLDPNAITEATGLAPDVAHRKGDPRQAQGQRDLPPWRSGVWSIDSSEALPMEGSHLEHHVTWLLDQIEPSREQLRRLCQEQELVADFYCGFFMNQWNSGVEISAGTLQRIVALGASFGIDIYAPEPGTPDRSVIIGGKG
jgi:hypothetical protein